jgi:aspartyl/glutamyl-tRNA(Asn/Gln) amidotransferase C subunit
MFQVTKDDIKKILNLSKLSDNPSDDFITKMMEQLNNFLEYAKDIQKIDVSSVGTFDGIRTIKIDQLREDNEDPDQEKYQRIRQNIINNFPKKQNNLLVIKGIFDNS